MNITDIAKTYIEKAMKENGNSTLRVIFTGPGCCGPNWNINLEEAQEGDKIETLNGLTVAIDQRVVDAVQGITLDFEGTEEEGSLVVLGKQSC
ncbi:adhesin [Brevibacillus sp. SYSU BS000544]|uniref:adhesin n=1 Tax=Brevibacillus sp. SYSU BS000544 TaxID=3416443 RepID=UPI003CE580F5